VLDDPSKLSGRPCTLADGLYACIFRYGSRSDEREGPMSSGDTEPTIAALGAAAATVQVELLGGLRQASC
jgi:hypothetical protein